MSEPTGCKCTSALPFRIDVKAMRLCLETTPDSRSNAGPNVNRLGTPRRRSSNQMSVVPPILREIARRWPSVRSRN